MMKFSLALMLFVLSSCVPAITIDSISKEQGKLQFSINSKYKIGIYNVGIYSVEFWTNVESTKVSERLWYVELNNLDIHKITYGVVSEKAKKFISPLRAIKLGEYFMIKVEYTYESWFESKLLYGSIRINCRLMENGDVEVFNTPWLMHTLLFPINVVPNIVTNTVLMPVFGIGYFATDQAIHGFPPSCMVTTFPIFGPLLGISDAAQGKPFWKTTILED